MAEDSEEVQEEREEVEEKEEEREERSDDFLSGTGGFGLTLGKEEVESGMEDDKEEEKGEVGGTEKAPGLAIRGEEGVAGEETGVPGVGVLDWLEYPLEGEARRCSPAGDEVAGWGLRAKLSPSSSELGGAVATSRGWCGAGSGGGGGGWGSSVCAW